jgi:20S proteasome subunit alpha 5
MQDSNCFSSDGRLFQLEYATEAIKLGSMILGIKTKFCVLLLLEKRKDDILNENIVGQKMIKFNNQLCCVVSGLSSDARFLVEKIQAKLENNFFVSNEISSVENCGEIILNLSSFIEDESEQKFFKNRPLGIAFLICGKDKFGFDLFQVDPTGILKRKEYTSLGSGQDESNFIIKEGFRKNMSSYETLELGKKVLKILTEKNFNSEKHGMYLIF